MRHRRRPHHPRPLTYDSRTHIGPFAEDSPRTGRDRNDLFPRERAARVLIAVDRPF